MRPPARAGHPVRAPALAQPGYRSCCGAAQTSRPRAQPEEPYWIGTLITCVFVQLMWPGSSCQMVSVLRWAARALISPPVPGASVAVPAGSAGSAVHVVPPPVITSARPLAGITAAVPAAPKDADVIAAPPSGSGADSDQ